MKISAFVITYNEEYNIEECLRSLTFCDEIVVVDSFSTDSTVKISENYTNQVFTHQFENYSEQRKFAIEKCSNDWVLWLDADERVTDELRAEISALDFRFDGYELPRKTIYLGKWIKHCGWYPDYHTRLFNKNKMHIDGRPVHEGISGSGKIGRLENPLLHFSYKNISEHILKMDKYTTFLADNYKKNASLPYLVLSLWLRPVFKFTKMYLIKLGFLDGIRGVIVSALSAFYVFLKFAKIIEKRLSHEG